MPKESHMMINGHSTHLMSWSEINPWNETVEAIKQKLFHDIDEVIIFIPGDPGLPGFYTQFLSTISETVNNELPVWVLSHAGIDFPSNTEILDVDSNKDSDNLKAQLQHKVAFIEKYVPKDVKIYLIGHSIGAWMVLEMLDIPRIKERIKYSFLLFPIIEKMKMSPKGQICFKYVNSTFYIYLMKFCTFIFTLLPKFLQIILAYIICIFSSIPTNYLGTLLKLMNHKIASRIINLMLDEMNTVVDLKSDIIRSNLHSIKFYYGAKDDWIPNDCYQQLKNDFPNIDAEICSRNIDHCFTFKSSNKMGIIVGDWIIEKRKKTT